MSIRETLEGAAKNIGDLATKGADKIATAVETVKDHADKIADDVKAEAAKLKEAKKTTVYAVGFMADGLRTVGLFFTPSAAELAAEEANRCIRLVRENLHIHRDDVRALMRETVVKLNTLFPDAQSFFNDDTAIFEIQMWQSAEAKAFYLPEYVVVSQTVRS